MSAPANEPSDVPQGEATGGLTMQQFPETLALVKLAVGAEVPSWAESSSIFSITATATETSLICAGRDVPKKVTAVRGLHAFRLGDDLEPTSVGVLAALLGPLADDNLPTFVITTHDTVWVMVRTDAVDRTIEAWRRRGHVVEPAPESPDTRRSPA